MVTAVLPSFKRLLSTSRKTTKLKHTPWCYRQPRAKETPEKKKERRERRLQHKTQYAAALEDARQATYDAAVSLHQHFGKHSIQYYHAGILQQSKLQTQKKKLAEWNAFVSLMVKQHNDALPIGIPHQKASDIMPEISAAWKALTTEEKSAATAGTMTELTERREMHDLSERNGYTLQSLRGGTETLLISCRSNEDQYNCLFVHTTSERVDEFLQLSLKQTPAQVGVKMEAYFISGINGVSLNYASQFLELKRQLSTNIVAKLTAIIPSIKKMVYVNFEDTITFRHGVVIKNWPISRFCNPSNCTRNELQLLWSSWSSGTTYFYQLSPEERAEWEAKSLPTRTQIAQGISTQAAIIDAMTPPRADPGAGSMIIDQPQASTPLGDSQPQAGPSVAATSLNFFNSMAITNADGESVLAVSKARKSCKRKTQS
ncbi:hypothetical protein C8J56DRAFT_900452 [Mycena floridula]|nr:hypothetical protein C8J56DRAFT_900452 [Mycena floridula]